MASEEMKATEVAALLDLKPHPEGGFYAETFRDGSITLTTSQLPPHCTYIPYRLITAQWSVCCTSNLQFLDA
jgi:predicted cupin superfamily sugar epimerase